MITEKEISELKEKALELRALTIDAIGFLGVGHIGGAMSIIEVLTILYYRWLRIDVADPVKTDRDRFVLSKGHAGPSLYSVLADKGYFSKDWLHSLNKGGTRLPSHCDMNLTPGIDFTTGSLGQGASAAVGIALGQKLKQQNSYTYLLIGDGESNEGQVWEAAMCAAQYNLENLIAFTDYNKQQLDGFMHDIMSIDDLNTKWTGFGWKVERVNGHDFFELDSALARAHLTKGRPTMIILDTIKGKGFYPGERAIGNHNLSFDYGTAKEAIQYLYDQQER